MLTWAERLKGSPKQPYFHAAVLAGLKLYSFGGWHDGDASGDQMAVHVFDTVSSRWAKLPPMTTTTGGGGGERRRRPLDEVPSMRYGHTAVLMADELVYIWGGYPYCDALYLYAGGSMPRWSKPRASGTAPAAREGHSACTLHGTVMYVHGGWNQLTGYTNDLHKMDSTGASGGGRYLWSAVYARGVPPPASYCHSATVVGTRIFVFGGVGSSRRSSYVDGTVGVFDLETGHWLSPAAPSSSSSSSSSSARPRRRWCHVAFAHGGALYVFGGCDATRSFGDLWRLDAETLAWSKAEPRGSGPGPMCRMCCCVQGEDRVLLFGGLVGNSTPADDLYVLDFAPSLRTLCRLAVARYYIISCRETTGAVGTGRNMRRP